jgi:hypothetical protein
VSLHRPAQKQKGLLDFGSPLRRCTDILLGVNLLCYLGQWLSGDALMLWGAKINSLIAAGQWWRLLTSSFLHTSLFHLLVGVREVDCTFLGIQLQQHQYSCRGSCSREQLVQGMCGMLE